MMKLLSGHFSKALIVLLSSALLLSTVLYVRADDTAKELEGKASSLEQMLSDINKDLLSISSEIDATQMQIEITNAEILRTQDSLKSAKNDEARQFNSMKSRIKYMYESGNSSLLELLFSAESLADFINKADFIQTVTAYDRDMLGKLQETRENISLESLNLEQQRSSLVTINEQLDSKQAALQKAADDASVDLNEYYAKLEILRQKEAEAARQREEEEARKRREKEAAAKKKQDEEDAKRKVEEDKKREEDKDEDKKPAPTPPADRTELDIFAALLQCESAADYNSMLAVATVIMNRVESPRFANTVTDVIYSPGQFEPVWTGRLDLVLARGPVDIAYTVAADALNGKRLEEVSDCYYFLYAGATDREGVNIGNNLFFPAW